MRKILLTTIGIICFFIGEAFAESVPREAAARGTISGPTNTSATGNVMNMRSMRKSFSYSNINQSQAMSGFYAAGKVGKSYPINHSERGDFYTSGKVGKSYPINHSERGAAAISQ